jgi:exodeoxyribonuclease V alpha subunit
MVDTFLMYHLLSSVPSHATVVIVGDINQLPSIGAGSILKDIINSEQFPVVELNQIFRQSNKSSIVWNAHRIINGDFPEIDNHDGADFYFIEDDDQDTVLDKIVAMIKDRIPKKFGYNPITDVQVLSPMNRGIVGVQNMNTCLQSVLNPNGFEITHMSRKFRIGDKVMQIRNNYDKEVFNGDIGIVSFIDPESQVMYVNIDGNDIHYEYSELDELVLAYATSIHKSQGSEYPVVVMPLVTAHYMMLQRNLVYTGVTRGKKLVIIVGGKKAMYISIKNDRTMRRNTRLCDRLKDQTIF